jgi:hypothetical protein
VPYSDSTSHLQSEMLSSDKSSRHTSKVAEIGDVAYSVELRRGMLADRTHLKTRKRNQVRNKKVPYSLPLNRAQTYK